MKKMLALGGIVAVPLMFLAIPQVPHVVLVLVLLGFGPLSVTLAFLLGLIVFVGVFAGGGNSAAALLAIV